MPPSCQGGVREVVSGRCDLAEVEQSEEAEAARRSTRRAVPHSGARCPRSLSVRGGREHACRGRRS
jgi:hypothetical protein